MTASISSLVGGALIVGGLVGDFAESAEDGREVESCVPLCSLLFMYYSDIVSHGLGKHG